MALKLSDYDPAVKQGAVLDIPVDLTDVVDNNGNELLEWDSVASAVNYIRLGNSATGNGVDLSAQGDDTNVNFNVTPKGTGAVVINNGTDPVQIRLDGAAGGYNNEITDLNGNEIIQLQGVASAVNEISVLNAATGNSPTITATGGDSFIPLQLTPTGTASVLIGNSGTGTVASGSATINAQRGVVTTGALTTGTASTYTFDLVNNKIGSESQVITTLSNGTNTGGLPSPGIVTVGTSGSATVTIVNADSSPAGTAFNGTLKVNFIVLS